MSMMLTMRCTARYEGLTVDIGRQKLYYAGFVKDDSNETGTGGKVGELSTDGTGHRVLFSNVNSIPRDVVLDNDNR